MKGKGLRAAGIGGGCTVEGKINLMSVTFDYEKVMTFEEARNLIVDCSNELLKMVNADSKAARYFEVFPIKEEIIRIAIISKAPVVARDHIRLVFISGGEIIYYADDLEKGERMSIIVLKEPFAEAKEIVSRNNLHLSF